MYPENFRHDYKQIAMKLLDLQEQARKVVRAIKTYEPKEPDELETLRVDIVSYMALIEAYINSAKQVSDKLGGTLATINELKPEVQPGIRRFIFVDNVVREVSLEEAANAEGLSIPEYLDAEQRELASVDLEAE